MGYSRITCYIHEPKFLFIFPAHFPEHKFRRRLCIGLLSFIALVLFVILVIYLVLRPQKPQFSVQDAVIRHWNFTADGTLTSELQFTIILHNPNHRIGVYYDRMGVYASYMYEQITPYSTFTPFYKGQKDASIISAIFGESAVPLAPFVAENLRCDLLKGIFPVNVRIEGKIRWKVGTWTSGHYHLNVNCFPVMGFTAGCCNGNQVPLVQGTKCDVSV